MFWVLQHDPSCRLQFCLGNLVCTCSLIDEYATLFQLFFICWCSWNWTNVYWTLLNSIYKSIRINNGFLANTNTSRAKKLVSVLFRPGLNISRNLNAAHQPMYLMCERCWKILSKTLHTFLNSKNSKCLWHCFQNWEL